MVLAKFWKTNMNTLQIEGLSKKYGKQYALYDVSITLTPGIYGLLGHNGAGKSTLIKILCGSLIPDEGNVVYRHKNIKKLGKNYRNILGYMPQQQSLDRQYTTEAFLWYIADLKGIPNKKEKIEYLIQRLNLNEHRHKRLDALSGGMKQRVLIAQALLNDPEILLLDEPTAGLDPVERRNFRKIISDIAQDKIVILATHMMSDIEFIAQHIILMQKGRVIANATQEELLKDTKVYVSDLSEEQLTVNDPTIKLVNTTYVNGKQQTRFISEKEYPNAVPATMDDVYLDRLG